MKGNEATKQAFELLKNTPINFIGNVEGNQIFTGGINVIVCDGFVGNALLKTSGGMSKLVREHMTEEFKNHGGANGRRPFRHAAINGFSSPRGQSPVQRRSAGRPARRGHQSHGESGRVCLWLRLGRAPSMRWNTICWTKPARCWRKFIIEYTLPAGDKKPVVAGYRFSIQLQATD